MLNLTHAKIADFIGKELRLTERNTSLLRVGSTYPDSWKDFPHHRGKEDEILKRIFQARALFLENDDECFTELGHALHYIADRWTLRPRIDKEHTEWEIQIEKSPILGDEEFLQFITNLVIPQKIINVYNNLAKSVIKLKTEGIKTWFNPKWGVWWKDYESLLIPYVIRTTNYTRYLNYLGFNGDPYGYWQTKWVCKRADKQAFHAAVKYIAVPFLIYKKSNIRVLENLDKDFLKPVISGIPLAIRQMVIQERPLTWSHPNLDLNFALRFCLEIARYTLMNFLDVRKEWMRGTTTDSNAQLKNEIPEPWKTWINIHRYLLNYGMDWELSSPWDRFGLEGGELDEILGSSYFILIESDIEDVKKTRLNQLNELKEKVISQVIKDPRLGLFSDEARILFELTLNEIRKLL